MCHLVFVRYFPSVGVVFSEVHTTIQQLSPQMFQMIAQVQGSKTHVGFEALGPIRSNVSCNSL